YELDKKRVGGSISVSFQTPTLPFATEVNRNVYRRYPLGANAYFNNNARTHLIFLLQQMPNLIIDVYLLR
ncbi:hypothetical protein, partial [Nostoc sp. NMS4]|uniref:hypothetical protein n=1 Tax=Nostoc sp. NMS4 TaxID=2815390 RepID=UPI0025D35AE2